MTETDPKRKAFLEAKARVEKIETEIDDIQKPFYEQMKQAIGHLQEEREEAHAALDEAMDQCPSYVGKCDACEKHLFEGDKAFKYTDDEIYLCEEHAPTNADILAHYESTNMTWEDTEFYESAEEFEKHKEGLRANLDEKVLWVL